MAGTLKGTDEWFGNKASRVSAHYGVGRAGEVHQYVADEDTAFHAGTVKNPTWKNLIPGTNPNSYTIGIEHEGNDGDALTPEQMRASALLLSKLCAKWSIPMDADHIIPHHAIRSTKTCPGNGVDIHALIELSQSIH